VRGANPNLERSRKRRPRGFWDGGLTILTFMSKEIVYRGKNSDRIERRSTTEVPGSSPSQTITCKIYQYRSDIRPIRIPGAMSSNRRTLPRMPLGRSWVASL
jgi:hypothetical protein